MKTSSKKHFLSANSKISNICLSPSKASTSETTVEKTHFQKATEFPDSKPTIQEALDKIHRLFVEGTQGEWLKLAMETGLSQKEAETLFENLKGENLFWFNQDDKTLWRWV